MAKKFSELRAAMSPQARAQASEIAQTMLNEMPLHELRQARGLSQKMLADVLHGRGTGDQGDLVSPEGAGMGARVPGVIALVVGQQGQRKATAQCLGENDGVGHDAGVFVGKQLACSAKSCLHLVQDQGNVVALCQRTEFSQPVRRRRNAAPFALDGLQNHHGGFGDAAFRV